MKLSVILRIKSKGLPDFVDNVLIRSRRVTAYGLVSRRRRSLPVGVHIASRQRGSGRMVFVQLVLHRSRGGVDGTARHSGRVSVHEDEDECGKGSRNHTREHEHDEYRHCFPCVDGAPGLFPCGRARNRTT